MANTRITGPTPKTIRKRLEVHSAQRGNKITKIYRGKCGAVEVNTRVELCKSLELSKTLRLVNKIDR